MGKTFVVSFVLLVGVAGLVKIVGEVRDGRGVLQYARTTDTGLTYVKPSQFGELLAPVYLPPKTINIPKLGLNSEIGAVAVIEGRIGVPDSWDGIGYFTGSSLAGEAGNTIIVGHLDDDKGQPAAFWNIRKLAVGDVIAVGDGHRSFEYHVLGSAYVPDGSSDVLQEDLGGPGLILVTCGGAWNPATRNYSQRLLVKTVLVK